MPSSKSIMSGVAISLIALGIWEFAGRDLVYKLKGA